MVHGLASSLSPSLSADLDIQYQAEQNHDPDTDKVKIVNPCYSFIEASSNTADIYKMTNGETVSFWQSDGSARSHWIRQGCINWITNWLIIVTLWVCDTQV